MKLMRWIGAIALAGTMSLGLVACKKGAGSAVTTALAKTMETSLGIKPVYVLTFNLKAIRNSPPAQEALGKYRKEMVASLKKSPVKDCGVDKLVDQMDAAAVLGFDNMNWNYVAVKGSFDANKLAACMSKSAKGPVQKQKLHGKEVFAGMGNYVWVASSNSIVALIKSTKKSPLGPATLKADDVLKKLLTGKDALAQGQISAGKQAMSFRVEGLSKVKLPKMAKKFVPNMPNTLWGGVQVSDKLSLDLNVEMSDNDSATMLSKQLNGLSTMVPAPFNKSLNISNKAKVLNVAFSHNTKELIAMARKAAEARMKRRMMRRSRFRRDWKVKPPTNAPSAKKPE